MSTTHYANDALISQCSAYKYVWGQATLHTVHGRGVPPALVDASMSNWLVLVQGLGLADRCDWLWGRCNKRLKEVHEGGRMYPVHEES